MRKIILIVILAVCLTACGNNDVRKEDNSNKEIDNIINEENNLTGNEITEDEENSLIDNEVIKESEGLNNNESKEDNVNQELNKEENQLGPMENIVEKPKSDINSEEIISDVQAEPVYEDGVDIGKRAIDFEVELLSGEKVKLSDYFGKPIFLNFWATWCGPCVGEMPDIEKVKAQYGDKITILAINGGELKDDVKAFIDRKGYTFNIGLNEEGNILDTYDSMYIPLSVFIDENGVIKDRRVGALSEDEMFKVVKDLLNIK